ncbi:MAG TPA: UDP-N-acetylglucosamine 2-epimerase (non-hydrolyzing) [Clostridia bacterium]|nr:UDP-N-acetylglucosamine 2-epimerase (non-hydrolyzing) [Clostridia bacterium]
MAPVVKELESRSDFFLHKTVVTAQHREMLDQVLEHFGIVPAYDLNLMTPRQSLTDTCTRVLVGLEGILKSERPDLILVHGDTITTFAAALAGFFQKTKVGHVEAGLRSGKKYEPFPEEMNRRLTAAVTDLHFAPTPTAKKNLLMEGIKEEDIFVTGNTVIDALYRTVSDGYTFSSAEIARLLHEKERLILVDVHRRENFGQTVRDVCRAVKDVVLSRDDVRILFSVHKNPEISTVAHEILSGVERIHLFSPLSYPDWSNLLARAYFVVTDSGGIQEEAPALGTPVLVVRNATERPEALLACTVMLIGTSYERIRSGIERLLDDDRLYRKMACSKNPYGDGHAAERIAEAILYATGRRTERPPAYEPFS